MKNSNTSEKTIGSQKSTVKLNALVKIFGAAETILDQENTEDESLRLFIKELGNILTPYRNLEAEQFIEIVKSALQKIDVGQTDLTYEKKNLGFDLEQISHEELKTVISQNTLSKEQLLLIGETRFGLSRGTLRKSKKKDVQGQIISAIQNIETLDAIKRKAGE
jgi:hypothetical protein